MAVLSQLHPLVRNALRTGKIPADEVIARVIGEEPEQIARLREQLEQEQTDDAPEPDEARYQQLVAAMIDDWYEDHGVTVRGFPDQVRERIEAHCRRQVEREREMHGQDAPVT